MKQIETLISDIEKVILEPHEFAPERVEEFGQKLARTISEKINPTSKGGVLRLSNLGQPDRKLWYTVNDPGSAEPLSFAARVKFLFGDILEELLLFLAKEAGHVVTGEQTTLSLSGTPGHRDAIIDGVLVDVKSASSRSFDKFSEGLTPDKDPFGYLTQASGYLEASQDDPLLVSKDRYAFLVIDKQLGHICLDQHKKSSDSYSALAKYKQEMVKGPLPPRCYSTEPDGYTNPKTKQFVANGNEKLGTECNYCPFKQKCWPGLRTFIYSNGLKHFTKIVKEPNVPEITKKEKKEMET